jgi:hypothetical protein
MEDYELQQEDYDLFCPIVNDVFEDPVKAEDGKTYERSGIESWFQSLRQRDLPIISPWTRREIGEKLVRDEAAAERAKGLRQAMKRTLRNPAREVDLRTALQGVSSIHDLRSVFGVLDEVRDVLEQTLDGWQPPQLVVMGQESSGKSSLMERLAMMPIFPRDKRLCTRVPIHVRLRNADKCEAATLEVHNVRTGDTEEEPYVIPTAFGAVDVREKMQVRRQTSMTAASSQLTKIVCVCVFVFVCVCVFLCIVRQGMGRLLPATCNFSGTCMAYDLCCCLSVCFGSKWVMVDGGYLDAGDHREGARQRYRGCKYRANHHPDDQEPVCAEHRHGGPSWTCDGPRKHEARHQAGGGRPRAEARAVLDLLGDGGGDSGAESESRDGDCAVARAGGQDHWGADQVRPCNGNSG